jgi:hypothetical protein
MSAGRQDNQVNISADHFRLTIDGKRGGQICDVSLFDGSQWNRLLGGDGQTCPAVRIGDASTEFRLDLAANGRIEGMETSPDLIRLTTTASPCAADGRTSPWTIRLQYEVYAEGAVFVTIECRLPEGESTLNAAEISFVADRAVVESAKYRQQVNCQEEMVKTFHGEGLPSVRLAFGVNPDRSFTNEVQAIVENKAAIAGEPRLIAENGRFTWTLAGERATIRGPFQYTNRLALGLGAAATGKPRSNLVAQRVYHWINWINREDVAGEAWYPSDDVIDRMAANHATLLVLHEHWMAQQGNNGKPHANYQPRDENALVRTIQRAHERGLRVGVYSRGIERYAPATGFFEKYLKRDWDGLYVDWHGVYCVAHHENGNEPDQALGDSHWSKDGMTLPARDYFLYIKRLREIVGPQGFLIGHQGFGASGVLANLATDAFLPGESSRDHDMLNNVDTAVYKGMLGGGICMPWTIDAAAYTSPQGVARMAAWGFYPHTCLAFQRRGKTLYPPDPNSPTNAFALAYWRVLAAVDAERCTVFNSPAENRIAARCSNPGIACLIYKEDGNAGRNAAFLVVAVNLSDGPGAAQITLDPNMLGMTGEYRVERIDSQTGSASAIGVASNIVATSELAPWQIEGIRLTQAAAPSH